MFAFVIFGLTASFVAMIFIVVFGVNKRLDKAEKNLTAGWIEGWNKLSAEMDVLKEELINIKKESAQVHKELGWVKNGLEYLCEQVLGDFPMAVDNARRIARGESIRD